MDVDYDLAFLRAYLRENRGSYDRRGLAPSAVDVVGAAIIDVSAREPARANRRVMGELAATARLLGVPIRFRPGGGAHAAIYFGDVARAGDALARGLQRRVAHGAAPACRPIRSVVGR